MCILNTNKIGLQATSVTYSVYLEIKLCKSDYKTLKIMRIKFQNKLVYSLLYFYFKNIVLSSNVVLLFCLYLKYVIL